MGDKDGKNLRMILKYQAFCGRGSWLDWEPDDSSKDEASFVISSTHCLEPDASDGGREEAGFLLQIVFWYMYYSVS